MDKELHGNLHGINDRVKKEMEAMYDIRMRRDQWVSGELVDLLAQFTTRINREIIVLIARDGTVRDISVGQADNATFPMIRTVRSLTRLSGVRCLHTHPNGNGMLSEVDLGALKMGKLDGMSALGVSNGLATNLFAAWLTGVGDQDYQIAGPLDPHHLPNAAMMEQIRIADRIIGRELSFNTESVSENAILVGLRNEGMDELALLAKTAGAKVLLSETQLLSVPNNATYIGGGKIQELARKRTELGAEIFIFDDELSAPQIRNLEEALDARVIDRTTLILDIFAQHAKSTEGKLQVELAQLQYMLPRLSGTGNTLSRLGGGIGTRGPGETKLETDRRRIRRRIFELKQEIEKLGRQRETRRAQRKLARMETVALIGYTNAGKSSLLNALTEADVLVEDKLFATLDPTTRRMTIANREVLLTDTVGFVQKLPTTLVDAFRSTLEETIHADLLVHVVDGSHPDADLQIDVVRQVLSELKAEDIPYILVYNKKDSPNFVAPPGAITISAKEKEGLEQLIDAISKRLEEGWVQGSFLVPYSRADISAQIRRSGMVLRESYEENGVATEARLPKAEWDLIMSKLKNNK